MKWNNIIWAAHVGIFMRQLLRPIAAFVCRNRQAPPAGATRPPVAGERLNAPVNSAHSLKLFYFINFHDGITREIISGRSTRPTAAARVWSNYSARNARIASAVLATAIQQFRLSVCLSVCPSHAGIVSKRRHVARCSSQCCIGKCV